MKIMTGKTGAPHVTSQQFRQLVEGTVGQDSYILTSGENLEPELQTNNLLKIRSGMMSHHGNLSVVELGTYDEVTIQNGTQGMKRIDLVVNRYTRNEETGVEENNWVVIQGTPAAESPSAPAYTNGNLQDGDLVDDCPVFRVHLDGINVTEIEKLLGVVGNISDLNGKCHVTEADIIDAWYCKKWSDGRVECYKQITVDISSGWDSTGKVINGLTEANHLAWHKIFTVDLPPGVFANKPTMVLGTADWDLCVCASAPSLWTTSQVTADLYSIAGNAVDQTTAVINMSVQGRWFVPE